MNELKKCFMCMHIAEVVTRDSVNGLAAYVATGLISVKYLLQKGFEVSK